MTTHLSAKPNFFQRLGAFLTGPASEEGAPTGRARKRIKQANQLHAVEVVTPLVAPDSFLDYAADGDEPADLALTSLIPPELALLNLPHAQPKAMQIQPIQLTSAPSSAALSSTTSSNLARSNSDILAADLADLTPAGLVSLNLQKKDSPTNYYKQPLPDLSSLPRENRQTASTTAINTAANTATPQEALLRHIPAQYLEHVNGLVAEMLDHQMRQARHNEQLGALVKQLLNQIAQQQRQLNALGQDSYSDIQQIVSTCLSGNHYED
ncbi:MAG: hypothetical protein AAFQ40_11985 [Cyanobacteria bacterium J06623_5]